MELTNLKKRCKIFLKGILRFVFKNPFGKFFFCVIYPLYQQRLLKSIKQKGRINVVFIASSLSLWRYQGIYNLLSKHPRFYVSIVILPFIAYTEELRCEEVKILKSYFDSLRIPYHVENDGMKFDIRKELSPDILFYPQPYPNQYQPWNNYYNFKDKLLCYYPYAFWMSVDDWSYNLPLHNYAWKLFYSTELHHKDAQKYAYNKGRNVEVVGYSNADVFLLKKHDDVWKPQNKKKKRIVWAPHFTITTGPFVTQSNFLWMSDFMLDVARKYSDSIQFVFKPHPRLKKELYLHADWGEERTVYYYNEWASNENTQLETGEFIDLFMTSDALIHDSGSFCVEYHYSGNPAMYIAENFEEQVSQKGTFGQLAMRQHYVGRNKQDIIDFIDNVVLKGDDPMKQGREEFFKQYLLPPNGKSVAENTMDVLLKAFC